MTDVSGILDGVNVVSMLGGGLGVALIQAAGRAYTQRTHRGEAEDTALARVLERRDEDCRRLGERLDASRTGEQLAMVQAAAFGTQLEGALEDIKQLKSDRDADREKNEDCERRYADVSERLRKVEKRITPPNGVSGLRPSTESADRIKPPIMSESVGGYRGRTEG